MMRRIPLVLLLVILSSFQSTPFNKIKINKKISILLPISFVPVPQDKMSTKFISYRDPIAAYTNETAEVEFGINTSTSFWRDTDVDLMRSFYKTNIVNLYDKVKFIQDDIQTINRRKFAVFEYISTINPENTSVLNDPPIVKYTYIEYAIIRGQVYLFDFTAPSGQKDLWQPVAQKIMSSVKIK
jgi:hypothetical protein